MYNNIEKKPPATAHTYEKDSFMVTIFFRFDDVNEVHENGIPFLPITFLTTGFGYIPPCGFYKNVKKLTEIIHKSEEWIIAEMERELGEKIIRKKGVEIND